MADEAFQGYCLDEFVHCYGGRLNQDGLQIRSYRDGEEIVRNAMPEPYYSGGIRESACGGIETWR